MEKKVGKNSIMNPEMNKRYLALRGTLNGLIKPTAKENVLVVRCNGYYREIDKQYSEEKFIFLPNDVVIDKHDIMSICLGVAKSPDSLEDKVLWFFSEGDVEPHYISDYIPKHMQREYTLLAVA